MVVVMFAGQEDQVTEYLILVHPSIFGPRDTGTGVCAHVCDFSEGLSVSWGDEGHNVLWLEEFVDDWLFGSDAGCGSC